MDTYPAGQPPARGYVHMRNAINPIGPSSLAFFGFVASLTPDTAAIFALASTPATGFTGSYVLTQSGLDAQYPVLAFPAVFGTPNHFTSGGFNYGLQVTQVTIVVNTIPTLFNVYLSPTATHVSSLTFLVS